MNNLFSIPYARRKILCCTLGLVAGIAIAKMLPADIIASVPNVKAAAIINGLIVGWAISIIGFINHHPLFKFRLPAFLRGAIIAVFMHLSYIIYIYGEPGFWQAVAMAAVFGGVVDLLATMCFGDGKKLNEGMQV